MANFGRRILNLIVLMVISSSVPRIPATRYLVGDSPNGWSLEVYYESWTSGKNFTVGDTLVFMYDHLYHSVSLVRAEDYEKCTSAKAIASDNSGVTEINLYKPGPFYFISSTRLFCNAGMRFSVDVVAESWGTDSSSTPSPPQLPPARCSAR
ncbi:stellacyanin-like [Henckelia pumila]|uniref:stellacyanin-like n=1 Tax=Henckelia pumila TaxID=405737 RepID=UPI003C6DFCC9